MSAVDILSDDDDDEMICAAPPAPAPAAQQQQQHPAGADGLLPAASAPVEPAALPTAPPAGLRSVVVASMDLADSSDDEVLTAPTLPAATAVQGVPVQPAAAADLADSSDDEVLTAPAPSSSAPPPDESVPNNSNNSNNCTSRGPAAGKRPAPPSATPGPEAAEVPAAKQPKLQPAASNGNGNGPAAAAAAAAAAGKKGVAPAAVTKGAPAAVAKLSKDEMETKVLEYMRQQNRPYNSQNVFDNLHGVVPKAGVQTMLDTLCGGGQINVKEYGKIKVYLAAQASCGEGGGGEEAAALQAEADAASAEVRELRSGAEELRRKVGELRGRFAATAEASAAEKGAAEFESRVAQMQAAAEAGGCVKVDEQEVARTEEYFRKVHGCWRHRKRLCLDALKAVGEGSGARLDALLESYGVDTDEDCGQIMPIEGS
ncbi:unnamed protein product [Polarella glacialis]|uniref:Homologous-pairing protein 2 winged helix domain-containing protein n=1 Tax=Polarella glacialis TaxID=89957 RepID=A0A813EGQ0_POLGL|nr:unnamed protein product [Polarella glacialis]